MSTREAKAVVAVLWQWKHTRHRAQAVENTRCLTCSGPAGFPERLLAGGGGGGGAVESRLPEYCCCLHTRLTPGIWRSVATAAAARSGGPERQCRGISGNTRQRQCREISGNTRQRRCIIDEGSGNARQRRYLSREGSGSTTQRPCLTAHRQRYEQEVCRNGRW